MARDYVYAFQHIECEDLGVFADVLSTLNIEARYLRPYAGDSIPERCDGALALIFLGGPMSVNDEVLLPHLAREKAVIQDALQRQQPVLGVCLGAQLLAAAAGSRVFPGARPEIGWGPVSLTMEGRQDFVLAALDQLGPVFHWHGETFDLPVTASRLAFSGLTVNQAIRIGANAYGLQFHLEVTPAMIDSWVKCYPNDLGPSPATAAALIAADTERYAAELRRVATETFQRFLQTPSGVPANGLVPR